MLIYKIFIKWLTSICTAFLVDFKKNVSNRFFADFRNQVNCCVIWWSPWFSLLSRDWIFTFCLALVIFQFWMFTRHTFVVPLASHKILTLIYMFSIRGSAAVVSLLEDFAWLCFRFRETLQIPYSLFRFAKHFWFLPRLTPRNTSNFTVVFRSAIDADGRGSFF